MVLKARRLIPDSKESIGNISYQENDWLMEQNLIEAGLFVDSVSIIKPRSILVHNTHPFPVMVPSYGNFALYSTLTR